jgi:hypothetical protein
VEASEAKAVLKLDSRSLTFESSERPGLNFSITREDLAVAETDGNTLTVAGRAEFHGRPINPRLQILSPLSSQSCRTTSTRRTCTSDVHILRSLLVEWRK